MTTVKAYAAPGANEPLVATTIERRRPFGSYPAGEVGYRDQRKRTMATVEKPSAREAKRLQTRERLMGAAIAEFKRAGMADADVGSIVTAAGVAHGTFFFHFPTKEHVLLELERLSNAAGLRIPGTRQRRSVSRPNNHSSTD